MNKVIQAFAGFYRYCLAAHFPSACKFYPSCSHYMEQATAKKGWLRGGLKGLWRILRCNPFSRGGYDPVD